MKKFLYIIFALAAGEAGAQSFEFFPSKVIDAVIPPDQGMADYQINIRNLKSTKLSVTWELVSNTYLNGWDYSLCDFGTCFIGIPPSHRMDTIGIGSAGFLKVGLSPEGIIGSGAAKMVVYETGDPSVTDTILFRITASTTTGIAGVKGSFFSVFPNPASDVLNIRAAQSAAKHLAVYSLDGREVMCVDVPASGSVDISNLPASTYMIIIADASNGLHRQTLIVR